VSLDWKHSLNKTSRNPEHYIPWGGYP
jgi:hypothetical protein